MGEDGQEGEGAGNDEGADRPPPRRRYYRNRGPRRPREEADEKPTAEEVS